MDAMQDSGFFSKKLLEEPPILAITPRNTDLN
jgi:hypothetical protein